MTTSAQSPRPALGPGWTTLSRALVALLGLALVGSLLNGAFSLWAWRTFTGWADDPARIDLDQATTYDTVTVLADSVLTLLHLSVLVVMIVWLFRAHRSDRMDPARLEHRSGWAIGGWFVPFLNLVRPYQVVEDVRLGSQSVFTPPSNVVLGWWLSVVGASLAERVTAVLLNAVDGGPDAVAAVARANLADVVASALWVVAAVLGILVVRSVTRLVVESPHAPRTDAVRVAAPGHLA